MIIDSLKSLAVPIDSLQGLIGNPRQGDVDAVARSLNSFGQRKPIVVRKDDGTIIAGNHTWQAAKKLGWTEIAVAFVGDDDVTAKAYALADNRTAELGSYDEQALLDLIEEVHAVIPEFVRDAGWSDEAVAQLVAKIESEQPLKEIDEDEIPKPPVEPVTKLDDIWQLGRHRLMCGDSTDEIQVTKLMNGEKADMVFTDPPYGINFESNDGSFIQNDNLQGDALFEFNKKWQLTAFEAVKDNTFLLAWASPRLFHLLDYKGKWKFFRLLTMYKSNRISFPHGAWINKTEPCLVFTKGKPKISTENYLDDCYIYTHDKESHDDSNVGHPTPKPVKMIVEHILACTTKEQMILDLFGGSGATMIACEKTNRMCYMMELDPKYCDVIIKRWETLTGEKAVLVQNAESA
jgi:site-specific DNA-methyltransferase (adenine-specific)